MDIGFTEEQELLRASARRFLENECRTAFVRQRMAEPAAMTDVFWQKLADQGWFGILYPEEAGGSGLGLVDMTVLMEEMGRAVMPGPFFSIVLLGGAAIIEAGSDARRQEWLPRIAAGSAKVSLAWTEPNARWDATGIVATGRETAGGFVLSGVKRAGCAFERRTRRRRAHADSSTMEDGVSLFLVPKDAVGLTVTLLPTIDETRKLCEVRLEYVAVPAAALLGEMHGGRPALSRVLDRATVALCAEMCGGAQQVLDMTTAYAKIRVTFGKPIGSYQGVKHRAADMLVDVENAKSLTYYAAWAIDEGLAEAPFAVSMAKAYTSDAYRKVAGAGIQLHGGIGFTWEHDLQALPQARQGLRGRLRRCHLAPRARRPALDRLTSVPDRQNKAAFAQRIRRLQKSVCTAAQIAEIQRKSRFRYMTR
jgi:alkylation response protein AidB-like acyl-CoA dehydrogenase